MWGTSVKLQLLSFLGAGQRAWATLRRSWDQWKFKPAIFSYENEPRLLTQGFCPIETGWIFHPSSKSFLSPQEWVYQERRAKEFKEATGATNHSVNITQCVVHVLAHVMASLMLNTCILAALAPECLLLHSQALWPIEKPNKFFRVVMLNPMVIPNYLSLKWHRVNTVSEVSHTR